MESCRLLGQKFHVGATCGKSDHVEAVKMAGDDVKPMDPVDPRMTTVEVCMGYACAPYYFCLLM